VRVSGDCGVWERGERRPFWGSNQQIRNSPCVKVCHMRSREFVVSCDETRVRCDKLLSQFEESIDLSDFRSATFQIKCPFDPVNRCLHDV
jgi:hypothetical protein